MDSEGKDTSPKRTIVKTRGDSLQKGGFDKIRVTASLIMGSLNLTYYLFSFNMCSVLGNFVNFLGI